MSIDPTSGPPPAPGGMPEQSSSPLPPTVSDENRPSEYLSPDPAMQPEQTMPQMPLPVDPAMQPEQTLPQMPLPVDPAMQPEQTLPQMPPPMPEAQMPPPMPEAQMPPPMPEAQMPLPVDPMMQPEQTMPQTPLPVDPMMQPEQTMPQTPLPVDSMMQPEQTMPQTPLPVDPMMQPEQTMPQMPPPMPEAQMPPPMPPSANPLMQPEQTIPQMPPLMPEQAVPQMPFPADPLMQQGGVMQPPAPAPPAQQPPMPPQAPEQAVPQMPLPPMQEEAAMPAPPAQQPPMPVDPMPPRMPEAATPALPPLADPLMQTAPLPTPAPPMQQPSAPDFTSGDGNFPMPGEASGPLPTDFENSEIRFGEDVVSPLPPAPEIVEPVDILAAVALVSPEVESQVQASRTLQDFHAEAATHNKTKKKMKKKFKADPLPFDMIVPGTPLVATVYSPSGGVGKSSTAMNMAVYIAQMAVDMGKAKGENAEVPRILVMDGDFSQGSLALRLTGNLTPSVHTLHLYLDERRSMGYEGQKAWPQTYDKPSSGEKCMLDFVMYKEDLPNLNLLAAPEEPDYFYDYGPDDFEDVIRMLGRFYDVIIIDSGTDIILESQRAWIKNANEVFLVTAPELDRAYNAAKAARYIMAWKPHPLDKRGEGEAEEEPPLATSDKISVVLTKYDTDSGLDPEQLMESKFFDWTEKRQRFYVPDVSSQMMHANNNKDFLVLYNPEYAASIAKLSQYLFARYAELKQSRALPE